MELFEEIYTEYSERIYRFLYRLCGSDENAEELTQETFYRAFKSFRKFRGDSCVFTWLASIAKFTYFNQIKKQKQTVDAIDLDSAVEMYCAESSQVENSVYRDEVQQTMRRMLHELPEKYRDVVMLRIYADMSFAQVAQALDITENSAKVIFYRAKKTLKERMTHEFEL